MQTKPEKTIKYGAAQEFVAALRANADRYHVGGDYAAFTAEQTRLWGAIRAADAQDAVLCLLRGVL